MTTLKPIFDKALDRHLGQTRAPIPLTPKSPPVGGVTMISAVYNGGLLDAPLPQAGWYWLLRLLNFALLHYLPPSTPYLLPTYLPTLLPTTLLPTAHWQWATVRE